MSYVVRNGERDFGEKCCVVIRPHHRGSPETFWRITVVLKGAVGTKDWAVVYHGQTAGEAICEQRCRGGMHGKVNGTRRAKRSKVRHVEPCSLCRCLIQKDLGLRGEQAHFNHADTDPPNRVQQQMWENIDDIWAIVAASRMKEMEDVSDRKSVV